MRACWAISVGQTHHGDGGLAEKWRALPTTDTKELPLKSRNPCVVAVCRPPISGGATRKPRSTKEGLRQRKDAQR